MSGWGEVWLRQDLHTGRFFVMHADPVASITDELLEQVRAGAHPDVTVDGDVLTINATNRRLIYRIGDYHAPTHSYRIEWPD